MNDKLFSLAVIVAGASNILFSMTSKIKTKEDKAFALALAVGYFLSFIRVLTEKSRIAILGLSIAMLAFTYPIYKIFKEEEGS